MFGRYQPHNGWKWTLYSSHLGRIQHRRTKCVANGNGLNWLHTTTPRCIQRDHFVYVFRFPCGRHHLKEMQYHSSAHTVRHKCDRFIIIQCVNILNQCIQLLKPNFVLVCVKNKTNGCLENAVTATYWSEIYLVPCENRTVLRTYFCHVDSLFPTVLVQWTYNKHHSRSFAQYT